MGAVHPSPGVSRSKRGAPQRRMGLKSSPAASFEHRLCSRSRLRIVLDNLELLIHEVLATLRSGAELLAREDKLAQVLGRALVVVVFLGVVVDLVLVHLELVRQRYEIFAARFGLLHERKHRRLCFAWQRLRNEIRSGCKCLLVTSPLYDFVLREHVLLEGLASLPRHVEGAQHVDSRLVALLLGQVKGGASLGVQNILICASEQQPAADLARVLAIRSSDVQWRPALA
mmetsp:Transcript_3788/g.10904  ORF Transcript_3788/g.10904 Transcript_3788/m.10904 type:complete len:229 (+) Transcript_3788:347-1033(+)